MAYFTTVTALAQGAHIITAKVKNVTARINITPATGVECVIFSMNVTALAWVCVPTATGPIGPRPNGLRPWAKRPNLMDQEALLAQRAMGRAGPFH